MRYGSAYQSTDPSTLGKQCWLIMRYPVPCSTMKPCSSITSPQLAQPRFFDVA